MSSMQNRVADAAALVISTVVMVAAVALVSAGTVWAVTRLLRAAF